MGNSQNIIAAFKNYIVNTFDTSVNEIKRKFNHTLRVVENAKFLAKKLNLNEELAEEIALLHDFARFNQWTECKSFNDFETFDHAEKAIELLFEHNFIKLFSIKEEHYSIIKYAIKYHNKRKIEVDNSLPKVAMEYCKLIRDADKIDLFNMMSKGELKIRHSLNGLTTSVLKSVENCTPVCMEDVHTKLDRILSFVGLIFDLNFKVSYEKFDALNFPNNIFQNYGKFLNEEDLTILKSVLDNLKKYIVSSK